MSPKPQPRRSELDDDELANASPVTFRSAPAQTPTPANVDDAPPARRAATKTTASKPKVSFYQDADDSARARAALRATRDTEGERSWSQFIDDAVMREVERLERKYNGGKPWPPTPTGVLRPGRRAGE